MHSWYEGFFEVADEHENKMRDVFNVIGMVSRNIFIFYDTSDYEPSVVQGADQYVSYSE